jgi:hypothetical protein
MRLWFIHILPRPPPRNNRDLFPAALLCGGSVAEWFKASDF